MKKCLIIENSYKEEAKDIGGQIGSVLKSFGVESNFYVLARVMTVIFSFANFSG